MHQKVLILDFGSQYTQLIARRIRELNIYSEIIPYNKAPKSLDAYKAVILSGSPHSVRGEILQKLNCQIIVKNYLYWVFATEPNIWLAKQVVKWNLQKLENTEEPILLKLN